MVTDEELLIPCGGEVKDLQYVRKVATSCLKSPVDGYSSCELNEKKVETRLSVVYDPQLDRFVLQELEIPPALPVSPTKRALFRKKESINGMNPLPQRGLEWEDLIIPPKSTTKRQQQKYEWDQGTETPREDTSNLSESPVISDKIDEKKAIESAISCDMINCGPKEHTDGTPILDMENLDLASQVLKKELLELSTLDSGKTKEENIGPTVSIESPSDNQVKSDTGPCRLTLQHAIVILRSLRRYIKKHKKNLSTTSPATIIHQQSIASSKQGKKSVSPRKANKARIPSYTTHFAHRSNMISLSALQIERKTNQRAVRWNNEVVQVSVPVFSSSSLTRSIKHGVLDDPGHSMTRHQLQIDDNGMTHIFDISQLQRIRPYADGFRQVNHGCTVVSPTSSSSSSSSSEEEGSSNSESDENQSYVFCRGDAVLVHHHQRWCKGVVLRRIHQSCFYDIKSANGTIFEAIGASKLKRLAQNVEQVTTYVFNRGDRVLWQPNGRNNTKKETYYGRILQIHSSHKTYDIQLRTGRVITRISYTELRPLVM